MSDPIIFSYGLSGSEAAHKLESKEIAKLLKHDDLAWVHLDATHPDAGAWLKETLSNLDPFVALSPML